jgi:hypothetical protein
MRLSFREKIYIVFKKRNRDYGVLDNYLRTFYFVCVRTDRDECHYMIRK